jgi:hypothetical protein
MPDEHDAERAREGDECGDDERPQADAAGREEGREDCGPSVSTNASRSPGVRTMGGNDAVPGDARHLDAAVADDTGEDRVLDIPLLKLHGPLTGDVFEQAARHIRQS